MPRLERTLDEWKTPSSRDHARAGLEHLAVIAELVEATNRLDELDPPGRAMRRSIDDVVIDDVEADRSARLRARARRLVRACDAVEEAIAVREIERVPPGPHLRAARRALDVQYKRAEREVFDRLPELVGTSDALVDPDLAGLVARQHELAEDLKLLRESLAWSDLVRQLKPNSSSRFNAVVQKLTQQLAQTTKRPEASRTFDTLATHFRGATRQPFLDRLRQTDREAIRMAGGRDRELLATFDEACAALIADWSDENPDGEGVIRFELLLRLLAQLEMFSELIEAGGSDHLSRWGGWLLHPTTGEIDPMLIASRLKIAIELLLRDDIQALANQLDQIAITAPLALLAARIGAELGPGLRELPESTGTRIARIARTPGAEDALVAYRDDLLKLARFTWELNEARKDGRYEDEQAIREYCAALAAQLVSDLEKP